MRGIGANIHYLSGGSKHSADEYYKRKIVAASFKEDAFRMTFEDGTKVVLTDEAQSCCERRYMTCDDDPRDLIGGNLRGISLKYSESEGDYSTHEICFVEIATDKCAVTLATHNEHNGYYGGFGLNLAEEP